VSDLDDGSVSAGDGKVRGVLQHESTAEQLGHQGGGTVAVTRNDLNHAEGIDHFGSTVSRHGEEGRGYKIESEANARGRREGDEQPLDMAVGVKNRTASALLNSRDASCAALDFCDVMNGSELLRSSAAPVTSPQSPESDSRLLGFCRSVPEVCLA
jgi:hypothetical protein